MKCKRCNKDITKEDCPLDDEVCEDCCNAMLMSQPVTHDFSHWDFEKGDYKK